MQIAENPPFRVRLWAAFAKDVPLAIVLRRGPRRHFQFIRWDLRKDQFLPGQWMKGDVRLWDLSPDGQKVIYWAHQHHTSAPWRRMSASGEVTLQESAYEPRRSHPRNRSPKKGEKRRRVARYLCDSGNAAIVPNKRPRRNEGCWTAVSVAPYFSALAIWPSFGHWTGGGVFLSDREILLNEDELGMTPKQNTTIPSWIKLRSAFDTPWRNTPPSPSAWHPRMCDPDAHGLVSTALRGAGVAWIEWIAPCNNGDLLFACDGCIYRLKGWATVPPERLLCEAKTIADLRNNSFTMIRAPHDAFQW